LSCSGSGSSFFSPPSLAQIIVYQWYCNILIRQLVFSPSIVNQVQDPSISLYLTVHSPAALILSDTVTVSMPRTLLTIPLFPANLQSKKLGSPVVSRWLCAPRPRGARYPSFLGSLSSLGAAHGPKWELVTQRITWFSQTRGACVPRSSGTSHPIPELCSSANL